MADARILIVEDEAIEAMDIQQRLVRLGYPQPELASSGEEAVGRVEALKPDLVLMDVMMPGKLDGIAAAEQISARFDIPIIFLTAYADESTLTRARVAKPYGYIVKPFQERELHIAIDVALYKHDVESRLRESQARLAGIIDSAMDAIVSVDEEQRIVLFNGAAERMFGCSAADALGQPLARFIPQRHRTAHAEHIRHFAQTGVTSRQMGALGEIAGQRANGEEFPIEASISQMSAAGRRLFTAMLRDITARKQAEDALRESEESYRVIAETATDAILTIDQSSTILFANLATEGVFGYSREELLGQSLTMLMPETLRTRHLAALQRYLDTGQRSMRWQAVELPGRHKSGRELSVEASFGEYYKGGQRLFAGIVRDITARKQGERELQRHRDNLEEMVRERTAALEQEFWVREGQSQLNEIMQGGKPIERLANDIVACLAERAGANVGALFLAADAGLELTGRYAYRTHASVPSRFALGEGLVGQAAAAGTPMLLSEVPEDYVVIGSGLGQMPARHILALPFRFGNEVKGVVELAAREPFTVPQREFLARVMDSIGIAVQTTQANERTLQLLAKSQQQAQELLAQQEELRVANEELETQARRLQTSEQRLKSQQEELQVGNEELEEKNELLERQARELEASRRQLAAKAEELSAASRYKSEFLANMSHELRTPLNSLLLLAQSLAQNKDGNLKPDQVEFLNVIRASGNDLLNLINEILDLSKIEAGRLDVQTGPLRLADLAEDLRASFAHMAQDKGLEFVVGIDPDAPAEIVSDRKRIEQILRNLISNALKFTDQGGIKVSLSGTAQDAALPGGDLAPERALAISVSDTGIGIPAEKHRQIFEAFQQADGSTTRKYGGTGLGLTISRELAARLGGTIRLQSEVGKGTTFTLHLPGQAPSPPAPAAPAPAARTAEAARAAVEPTAIHDDRAALGAEEAAILIIEDDPRFATVLRDQCHAHGFKCLAATSGETGLELAGQYLPVAAILDLRLPGMDGWTVLAALKGDTRTRHIPVHVVSVYDNATESLRRGAVGHAVKPVGPEQLEAVFARLAEAVSGRTRRVLVVEDDAAERRATVELIGDGGVVIDEAATGAEALAALRANRYDCLVLDLRLPDMDGRAMLARLAEEGVALPPTVVHTAVALSEAEEAELREQAEAVVVKDVRSPERLLDEVSLFLHRVVSRMPERQRRILQDLYDSDAVLRGKKALVADDDMRTTFAVAHLLAERGMQPLKAENGERALRLLAEHPDTALVLMDIMMPVMDGYEAMRRIRAQPAFRKLPIIALTAKAMPEDREKCLAAGASDYLAKPVDPARLVSMMRVWLYD